MEQVKERTGAGTGSLSQVNLWKAATSEDVKAFVGVLLLLGQRKIGAQVLI